MDQGRLSGWVASLERRQRKRAGSAQNWDAYQFTAGPTVPPSTSIVVRGGRACFPTSDGGISGYFETTVVDFAEDTSWGPQWPYQCQNPNWYVPVYVGKNYSTDPGELTFRYFGSEYYSYTGGGFVEYETAAEAEDAICGTATTAYTDHMNTTTIPVCRLVLRIESTGLNRFMPIDMVNRGRSYLLGQFRDGRYSV